MKPQTTQPISYSSVELMPNAKGSALFITDSSKVFKDDIDITPKHSRTAHVSCPGEATT